MATNHRDREDHRDQQDRIDDLKQQAAQAAKGEMIAWESETLSLDQSEQFWRHVVACEDGPFTTDFQRLTEAGVELPEPEAMDDEQLTRKLWEVINALATLRVFIDGTDHLSDRELYDLLWRNLLRLESPVVPIHPGSACHLDPLLGGSETDTQLYLKYYADEEWRRHWLAKYPDYDMPAAEDPPYDRDRHLPQPYDAIEPTASAVGR